jgi:hypothetical protein
MRCGSAGSKAIFHTSMPSIAEGSRAKLSPPSSLR